MNRLSHHWIQKLINSTINDLSLRCEILLYKVEKSHVEMEIVLLFEFILIITLMTVSDLARKF